MTVAKTGVEVEPTWSPRSRPSRPQSWAGSYMTVLCAVDGLAGCGESWPQPSRESPRLRGV